jgi:hypothetical protein
VVWAAALAVLLAFVLVVTGLTTPNPTALGADRLLDRPNVCALRAIPFSVALACGARRHGRDGRSCELGSVRYVAFGPW